MDCEPRGERAAINAGANTGRAKYQMNHTHVYILSPPNGPTSDGKCRGCGDVRKGMPNYIREPGWGGSTIVRRKDYKEFKESLAEQGHALQTAMSLTQETQGR